MASRRASTPPARIPPAKTSDTKISTVVPRGDLRASLISIRDRIAAELDDLQWSRHKRECNCVCGMTDPRSLAVLTKRLEENLAAIAALPAPSKGVSAVDLAVAAAAARRDELAARRASRAAGGPAS